ncbi:MAG: ComF family protein [Alphaproteobacteria bacterium]|nr:ComF family protein [Alphaproteobacteria bacterium]
MSLKEIINWIFPYKCIICGCEISENSIFCPKCFSELTFIDYPFCNKCGKLLNSSYQNICENCSRYKREFNLARALFQYDKYSANLIIKIKNQGDNYIAKSCAQRLLKKYNELFSNADFITPVPSHWSRIIKRGYNPASIIALELSKTSGITYKNLLVKTKRTGYQKKKNFKERLENVKDTFKCKENIHDKTIILVDDVFTTGSTLNSCSQALYKAGSKNIYCLTIATTKST